LADIRSPADIRSTRQHFVRRVLDEERSTKSTDPARNQRGKCRRTALVLLEAFGRIRLAVDRRPKSACAVNAVAESKRAVKTMACNDRIARSSLPID
jgi:hypothetical protein